MIKWKRITLVLVLLLTGFCFGFGSATMLAVHRLRSILPLDPPRLTLFAERFLDRKLNFTETQRSEVRPIIEDFASELIALRQQIKPQAQLMMDEMATRMEADLDTEQINQLREMIQQIQNHWELEAERELNQ
jgi:hypothetical protein